MWTKIKVTSNNNPNEVLNSIRESVNNEGIFGNELKYTIVENKFKITRGRMRIHGEVEKKENGSAIMATIRPKYPLFLLVALSYFLFGFTLLIFITNTVSGYYHEVPWKQYLIWFFSIGAFRANYKKLIREQAILVDFVKKLKT